MTLTIEPFQVRHTDGVRDLIVSIQRDEFAIPVTYAEQTDLHDIAAFYRKGHGEFWVALDGDEVVGSAALIDIGAGLGALRKMFVGKAYRGGGRGVAGRLLATLLAHAWGQGLSAIYLGTTAQFLAAHRFYEKNGFSPVAVDDLPPSFPRMSVDTRFYRMEAP